MKSPNVSRRQFLTAGAGGFTLFLAACTNSNTEASGDSTAAPATNTENTEGTQPQTTVSNSTSTATEPANTSATVVKAVGNGTEVLTVGPSLSITDTGLVIVRAPRAEMGQGVLSALAMLVAEELDADVASIRVVENDGMPAAVKSKDGGIPYTFASLSVTESWQPFRQLGASARAMLLAAAATQLKVPVDQLTIEKGIISSTSGKVSFAEVATAAASEKAPLSTTPKQPGDYRIIGKDIPRFDSLEKVNGKAMFASDVRVEGMLVAVLLRGPKFGSKPSSWDKEAAMAIPGVTAVVEVPGAQIAPAGSDDALAVVASGTWAAIKGREALMPTVKWTGGIAMNSSEFRSELRNAVSKPGVELATGDPAAAVAGPVKVDAVYDIGYAAHLLMEPLTAVARVTDTNAEIWVGHQAEDIARPFIELATGLSGADVVINQTFLGTGFGRRAWGDFVSEAAFLAKAVGKPVRIHWSREDDITRGFYRSARATRVQASINADGTMVGIDVTHAGDTQARMQDPTFDLSAGDGALDVGTVADQPYQLGTAHSSSTLINGGVPIGLWRGVEHNAGVFALESAVSELAEAAKLDDLAIRLALLAENPRAAAALQAAFDAAKWQAPTRERAFGMAIDNYAGTSSAVIAEVVADGSGWKVARLIASIDCGVVVSPNGLRAQMEGGLIFGLGSALTNEVVITDGAVEQSNFDTLRPLRSIEIPAIEIVLMPSKEKPTGGGEAVVPPTAAAVANAVAALTGTRQRSLPLTGWTGAVTDTA
jgi:isoquinoline 1-oxidoreductase subunit beta